MLSAVTGIGCTTILLAFGVDMAAVFGLLTFLLNFVPIVGSVIAGFLVLPVIVLQPGMSFARGFTAFMINGSWNSLVGNVLEPIVFGDKFDMHEVTVLAALALWGVIWGIAGAVLSIPITVVLLICLKSSKHPLAQLAANTLRGKFDDDEHPEVKEQQEKVRAAKKAAEKTEKQPLCRRICGCGRNSTVPVVPVTQEQQQLYN